MATFSTGWIDSWSATLVSPPNLVWSSLALLLTHLIERLNSATAHNYMGQTTLQSIIDGLPPWLRLLHAEVVLRAPLVRRFNEAREKMIKKYAEEARRRGGSRRAQ